MVTPTFAQPLYVPGFPCGWSCGTMPRKSVFQIKGVGQDGLDIHPVRRIQNLDPDDFAVAGRVEIDARRDLDGAVGRLVAQTQIQGIDVIVIVDFYGLTLFLSGSFVITVTQSFSRDTMIFRG
jgi:hypothetical protein